MTFILTFDNDEIKDRAIEMTVKKGTVVSSDESIEKKVFDIFQLTETEYPGFELYGISFSRRGNDDSQKMAELTINEDTVLYFMLHRKSTENPEPELPKPNPEPTPPTPKLEPEIHHKGLKGTFGIERDLSNSTTNAWRRIGDSANLKAVPVKRGESLDTYYSDFDKYYPWSEMKRVEKDGDTLVQIPPFYYRRYQDDKIERIEISSDKKDGFELHPGSGVYVGAYLVDETGHSARGEEPKLYKTRGWFRNKIRERGSNFWMYDVKTDMALKMLYLVEYVENNSQGLLNVKENDYYNLYDSYGYKSGIGDALGNKTGCLSNYMGNYRGIEGLLNGADHGGSEFIDGLIIDYDKYYISTDPNNYSDSHTATGYKSLSYSVPPDGYIKKHGLDSSNTWCMLPQESQKSNEFCGHYFSNSLYSYDGDSEYKFNDAADRVAYREWNSSGIPSNGLFYLDVKFSNDFDYPSLGARLIRSGGLDLLPLPSGIEGDGND